MASANLDLVRTIYALWKRGDFNSVEWADSEIEFVLIGGPEDGSWTGVDAMAEAWRRWLSPWEDFRTEAEKCRELDGERVLVLTKNRGRGKTSGLELGRMPTRGANVFHLRDGKVTRLVAYIDRDRALADLGLAPESDSTRS